MKPANPASDAPARQSAGFERLPVRAAEIGAGFPVARALPNARRRTVGAWCFLDHAGPVNFAPGGGMKVGPHPHIGLQTFTWMIEGEVLHRDSLGNEQPIRPGQVNLMTAGRGIAHSEESIDRSGGARSELPLDLGFEHALLCLSGRATADGEPLDPATLLHAAPGRAGVALAAHTDCRLLLIGGAPLDEPPLIWWNFVARTADEVVAAADDWNAGRRFGEVAGTALPRIAAPDAKALKLEPGRRR